MRGNQTGPAVLLALSLAAIVSMTVGFAQEPARNPGSGRGGSDQGGQAQTTTAPARGSASVRVPAWRQLRTAVGSLLGWQVGVPIGSFRQETFVEAASKGRSGVEIDVRKNPTVCVPAPNLRFHMT